MFLFEVFQKFNEKNLDYVIIGGVALVLHGVVRMTADLDLVVALERDNLQLLLDAMKELGYRPRVPVQPEALLDPEIRTSWINDKNMEVFSFYDPGKPLALVDIIIREAISYQEIRGRAVLIAVDGLKVPVVAVEDLIRLKKIAGRPQDLEDIKSLEEGKRRTNNG
jgi:predicted nucleotidyltransferase